MSNSYVEGMDMDCQVTYFKEKDSFITKLKNSDEQLLKFYQYDPSEEGEF